MPEWIGFDDATVSALTRNTGTQAKLGVGDALAVALAAEGPVLAVLAPENGKVQVITVRRPRPPLPPRPSGRATGFLGLIDDSAGDGST
jgi:hypothetical protein